MYILLCQCRTFQETRTSQSGYTQLKKNLSIWVSLIWPETNHLYHDYICWLFDANLLLLKVVRREIPKRVKSHGWIMARLLKIQNTRYSRMLSSYQMIYHIKPNKGPYSQRRTYLALKGFQIALPPAIEWKLQVIHVPQKLKGYARVFYTIFCADYAYKAGQ